MMESMNGQDYDDYVTEWEGDNPDGFDYYDDLPIREDISMAEMYEECAKPTLYSASDQLYMIFISCLIFKITTQLIPLSEVWCHIFSCISGWISLVFLLQVNVIYTVVIGMITYWGVLWCHGSTFKTRTYHFIMLVSFVYLVLREYVSILPEDWEQIRGIHMIIVLKFLSLCYDISMETMENPPPFVNYLGYIFCPANIIFGPWIPYNIYMKLYDKRRWSFDWVIKVFSTTLFAFLCLTISSCWVYWLSLGNKSSWVVAARGAIAVRFSNYFVAFTAEATSVLAGFHSIDDPSLNIEVSDPWKIELPRSLVEVVVHWNKPMHSWLKRHIFRPFRTVGHVWRIILTFVASSLLHGLNFSLSMVLLSLGIYTYVEHNLREKLASIFDACIRSRRCPAHCKHNYKATHPAVVVCNFGLGFLAYFHLAYLGVLMDTKHPGTIFTDGVGPHLASWSRLGYLSHWVVLLTYLFSILI